MKVKDENMVPDILEQIEYIKGKEIQVGVFGDEGSELLLKAGVNEFGAEIDVTPKMRAYLHGQGLHLKPDTDQITIPERSFIRSTFDDNIDEIENEIEKAYRRVLAGDYTGKQMLDHIGNKFVALVKKRITNIENPPNHPFTIKQKTTSAGVGDSPLIDSGQLRREINYRVV